MIFSEEEIEIAKKLRKQGLKWEPKAGHYVYDETGFCKQPSPFQEKVYFILNYNYFMKAVGSVEQFKEIIIWLPTWDDARELLRSFEVSDQQLLAYLKNHQAIERGTERIALYELIASQLTSGATPALPKS